MGARGGGAGCQAAHRAKARRRDGDIAPYRHAAREGCGWCARVGRGRWCTRGVRRRGHERRVQAVRAAMGAGVMAVGRDVLIAPPG